MRPDEFKFILKDRRPVPCDDLMTWARWFEHADRVVAYTEHELFRVSTIFLGLDHRFGGEGPPILFETMLFVAGESLGQWRYSSWDDAETGHKAIVRQHIKQVRELANGG